MRVHRKMDKARFESAASGYVSDTFEGVGNTFTDVSVIHASQTNTVYRAKRYGRWWTLKALYDDCRDREFYRQQQRKELEITMLLQHPAVVSAVGLEEVSGIGLCIVTEYVDGLPLGEWLAGKPAAKRRRNVARQLLDAVEYVHSKGIVHRDIKPENILVTHNGDSVKLIDFGLADSDSHAVLKQPAGTGGYMSPEQAVASVADVRNDIYSLGLVLSLLATCPPGVARKCRRPLDERYRNIAELRAGITNAARRRKYLLISACVAALCVAIWAITASLPRRSPDSVNSPAQTAIAASDSIKAQTEEKIMPLTSRETGPVSNSQAETGQVELQAVIDTGIRELRKVYNDWDFVRHLDTLTDIAYIRPELQVPPDNLVNFSRYYCRTLETRMPAEDVAKVKKALDDELALTGDELNKRRFKLLGYENY